MALKSLHIVARQMFYLIVIMCVLVLSGILAAIWLSGEVAKRKDEIAAWASQQTGYPVEIGSAGIYLFDLVPKLELDDLKISQTNSTQAVFEAKRLYLRLDLIATIQQQAPVLADTHIQEASFAVARDEQGNFSLIGVNQTDSTSEFSLQTVMAKMNWLQQVELNEIQITYHDVKQPQLSGSYLVQQFTLGVDDELWQLQSQIQLASQLGNQLDVAGWLRLDSEFQLDAAEWTIETADLQLGALLAEQVLHGVKIQQGSTTFKGTIAYDRNHQYQADLDIELNKLRLISSQSESPAEPVNFNYYHGVISWQQQKNSWKLQIPNQRVTFSEKNWPVATLKLSQQENGEIQLQSDFINLSDITALCLLVEDAPEFIKKAKPAGDISMLSLAYEPQQGLTALSLKASELGILPWQNYPGVDKLSFKLDWQQGQAKVNFDSHQTTVYAEPWLTEPAFLESITGQIDLLKQQQDWRVDLAALRLWNADFSIQADGYLSQQQQKLDSDIRLNLQDVVANRWKAYVPEHILQEDFKVWSAGAFVDGRIVNGVITMQGDPSAFPFATEPDKGAFDMQLQAENVQLHYGPGWPDLKQVNGHISGHGNDLLITSQSGMIADMQVVDAEVKIINLVHDKPVLTAKAKTKGNSNKALAFLKNSPLQDRFGDIAEWLAVTGESAVDLDLTVPLTNVDKTDVSGQVSFNNATVTTKAVEGLQLDKVTGGLRFNNHGVTAEAIRAQAFGRPVDIKVSNKSHQTWVDISGETSMTDLKTVWPDMVPPFVTGKTAYMTRLIIDEIKPGDFGIEVDVNSNLKGITVNAPQPLAKVPAEQAKFNLNIAVLPNQELGYRLQYRDSLSGFFSLDKKQKLIGEFLLGTGTATLRTDELAFVGRLDQLNADEWLQWQSSQTDTNTSFAEQLDKVSFEIGALTLFEQQFNAVKLNAKRLKDAWSLDLAAQQFNGRVMLPVNGNDFTPIEANLSYLNITLPESEDSAVSDSMPLWPAMKLTIEDLQLDNVKLGQLVVDAARNEQQWRLNSATLKSPLYVGKITGVWSQQKQATSQFAMEASSGDLKAVLGHFGYQQSIDATDVKLDSELSWSGHPLAISRQNIAGHFQLAVGRGKLIEVDPGTAGRIFGLMSIAALPRRLSLDFSDLFKKGFNFSTINGQFNIDKGIANTDDFVMKGDSATIELNGPINLVDKTYNQTVKVRPEVSSTLPIAGAVAGGPIGLGVGTAILLVDKIAGKVFDRELVNVISYQYQLTGPWDDPELKITSTASE